MAWAPWEALENPRKQLDLEPSQNARLNQSCTYFQGFSGTESPVAVQLNGALALIVGSHELLDFCDHLLDAEEAALPDLPLRDQSKPALHLVESGGVGGCVVPD